MKKITLFVFLSAITGFFLYMFIGQENYDLDSISNPIEMVRSRPEHQEQETSKREKDLESKVDQGKLASIDLEESSEVRLQESDKSIKPKNVENLSDIKNGLPENKSNQNKDGLDRFSKIDRTGNLLSADATNWSCIYDAETQLVWENKTLDSGSQDSNNRFSWFDPNIESGVFSGNSESENICTFYDKSTKSFCNTHNFIVEANKEKLCGFSGWRLPNIKELRSIVVNRGSASVVDKEFFANTQPDYYWTSDAIAYEDRRAWAIKFSYGAPKNDLEKSSAVFARLVVGNP